jgi:GNAT superfamily N-acetyltransferase
VAEPYVVRAAVETDLETLREIEDRAGQLFAETGMALVAGFPAAPVAELRAYADDGRAYVAAFRGEPVGYVTVEVVDGLGHIEQVSVDPAHGRRGLGSALVERAVTWAQVQGHPAVTLTTFVDLPWNGPLYARLGFRRLRDDELTEGLRAIRAHEAAMGLDAWPRMAMRREV